MNEPCQAWVEEPEGWACGPCGHHLVVRTRTIHLMAGRAMIGCLGSGAKMPWWVEPIR